VPGDERWIVLDSLSRSSKHEGGLGRFDLGRCRVAHGRAEIYPRSMLFQ